MGDKKVYSNSFFRFMSFLFRIRDKFHAPFEKIKKANIKENDIVLDYGCGPGSYTIAAAEAVGPNGKVFAADIHPLALQKVSKKAKKLSYTNIETIQTDCVTGLEDESVDVVICFDMFHGIPNKNELLKEFHRVLKPNSTLTFDDHHMKEDKILNFLTSENLFQLAEKKDKQYNFNKI
ncbi:MAG: class I SAM-dependent methyltransferase [Promethearchaeota archaeon]|jgi:ubiquinone/menaquinone biosynthesis C-methylase UbiE